MFRPQFCLRASRERFAELERAECCRGRSGSSSKKNCFEKNSPWQCLMKYFRRRRAQGRQRKTKPHEYTLILFRQMSQHTQRPIIETITEAPAERQEFEARQAHYNGWKQAGSCRRGCFALWDMWLGLADKCLAEKLQELEWKGISRAAYSFRELSEQNRDWDDSWATEQTLDRLDTSTDSLKSPIERTFASKTHLTLSQKTERTLAEFSCEESIDEWHVA